ncbi:cobalt ECF transporter S component CbiM [Methanobrevibacter sp. DSM 116169]|uniref:cobalt ECF transporter S component CbiM n=1 Tax=Methanobrevibacter sp. DSM 116169 TaxID=3242727 RepID=UPI0038FC5C9F
MHIMEGFLPPIWCIFWYIVSIPFVVYGIIKIKQITDEIPDTKSLLAVSGAYMFVISSVHVPSIGGTCSHITGNGLNASLFGPFVTCVLGTIVLLFQLFLLGYGGITTLGAEIFAYGIIGPFSAWLIYKLIIKANLSSLIGIFTATVFANLFTYIIIAMELALAFPNPTFISAFIKFLLIFAVVQIPLAFVEGIITVFIWASLKKYKSKLLRKLNLFGENEVKNI